MVDSGGFGYEFFFVFCFMLLQIHNVKYLLDHFPKYKQIPEKQSFFLKSFSFTNILRRKIIYIETNKALIENVFLVISGKQV